MVYLLLTSLTLLLLGLVLFWVRHDKLYLREATHWILISLLALIGLYLARNHLDHLLDDGPWGLGVIMLISILVLTVKSLFTDINLAQLHRELRRLNQHMAIMDAERHLRHHEDSE